MTPPRIPKTRQIPWGCRGCGAENSGEVEYCWYCGKDRIDFDKTFDIPDPEED